MTNKLKKAVDATPVEGRPGPPCAPPRGTAFEPPVLPREMPGTGEGAADGLSPQTASLRPLSPVPTLYPLRFLLAEISLFASTFMSPFRGALVKKKCRSGCDVRAPRVSGNRLTAAELPRCTQGVPLPGKHRSL